MKELQRLIDQCASASTRAWRAQHALNEYCERAYGAAPADVDADQIIDGVFGASGESTGMTAVDFDAIMRSYSKR